MFDCRETKTRLGRYFDGELPPAERLLVESHLQDCRLCSLELEEIRQFSMAFQGAIVTPEPPSAMAQRIMAQARAQEEAAFSARDLYRLWGNWPLSMRFAAVAVSVAACYIGLVIGSASLPSRRPAGDEMQWIGMTSRGPIVAAYVGAKR